MDLTKQKILVTGADGFIGSHLVEGLLAKGCQVRAFVFYNSFNSWDWLDTFPKEKLDKIDVFAGDIRDPNGKINISSQQEISIGQLAREIIDQINPTARIVSDVIRIRPEKGEVERLLGSNEKIRRLTGWQPAYTLKQGIRETIEWFRDEENLRRYIWNVYNV